VAATVQVGDSVRTGDVLGTVSTGSHCVSPCLHWGLLRDREYLDPLMLAASRVEMRLLPASALQELRVAAPTVTGAAVQSASGSGLLRPAGPVTSAFGMRLHPVRRVWSLHDGTDFAAPCGGPIVAPAAGVVTATAVSEAYGNRLFLDHGIIDGRRLQTASNHAQRYVVHAGERVQRGQVIGLVGSTGYSTGCHQHLMVWANGALADPAAWLGP
jgi:murein DD-endopeptidase MepM/ murein hydrolase activator NlpD